MGFCCKLSIAVAVMCVGGFIVLGIGLGVEGNRQSEAPFLTWLGFGLGLIVLGIIVMLVGLFVFVCKELGEAGIVSFRRGERQSYEWDNMRGTLHSAEDDDQSRHQLLDSYLREECVSQNQTDLMKVADTLERRWLLPGEIYNIYDIAVLCHTLHQTRMYGSVILVARAILDEMSREARSLKNSTDFRADLFKIRSNHEPGNFSTLANLYVLLKSKSRNTSGMDYSPKSNIQAFDIPGAANTTSGASGATPSAPPSYTSGSPARATGPSSPEPDIPSIPPPSYDEVIKEEEKQQGETGV